MKRLAILLLIMPLAGCSGLSIGSLAGTASINFPCGTGGTIAYSAGIIPQMQPVTASCTTGNPPVTSMASITPGIDMAALSAMVIQGMATKGMVLTPARGQ
jgi:hypothetical protein